MIQLIDKIINNEKMKTTQLLKINCYFYFFLQFPLIFHAQHTISCFYWITNNLLIADWIDINIILSVCFWLLAQQHVKYIYDSLFPIIVTITREAQHEPLRKLRNFFLLLAITKIPGKWNSNKNENWINEHTCWYNEYTFLIRYWSSSSYI